MHFVVKIKSSLFILKKIEQRTKEPDGNPDTIVDQATLIIKWEDADVIDYIREQASRISPPASREYQSLS